MDKGIISSEGKRENNIFVKIKEKREKHAKRCNESKKITKFSIGDKVLVRTYHQSDAMLKKIDKFFELFSGPYKINRIIGEATYELVECDSGKVRGRFNIRRIKAYHEPAKEIRIIQESNNDSGC